MFLAAKDVFYICQNPVIDKVGSGGNFILKNLYHFKNILAERISLLYHEPHASFMAGLLYGYNGGLGDLQNDFKRTGISHIIAISGYNIALIATILLTLCIHLWIPRKKSFWIVSSAILLFVIFVGASGSVVRAGIMGFLVLFTKQIGRPNRIGNTVLLTAVLMCLFNPFILVWDVGFQLSFMSMIGLVYISPIIQNKFTNIPEFFGLKESLVSTLSAIAGTFPLMMYQFGNISIVAPIVNVLVLWLIPWIMMIGFFSVVFSFIFYPIGRVLAWLAWIFMEYIILIVKWFANLPFASAQISISFWIVLLIYFGLIYLIKYNNKKMP
jgi:competence protein ComEC